MCFVPHPFLLLIVLSSSSTVASALVPQPSKGRTSRAVPVSQGASTTRTVTNERVHVRPIGGTSAREGELTDSEYKTYNIRRSPDSLKVDGDDTSSVQAKTTNLDSSSSSYSLPGSVESNPQRSSSLGYNDGLTDNARQRIVWHHNSNIAGGINSNRQRTRTIVATRTALFATSGSSETPPSTTMPLEEGDKEAEKEETMAPKNKMKFRNFDEMLEQFHETPVLVSWGTRWCGPCKLMKKELKVVRDALGDDVLVANVDTEKFPSLGARYKVEGLPTVLLFKDGEPVHRIEGLESANEILRQVREFL